MTPMNVVMLTTFYPPYNFGGDGIGVQRLAQALARQGHQVTVVHDADAYNALSATPDPVPTPGPDLPNLRVVPMRSGTGILSPLLTQQTGRPLLNHRRLRSILGEERVDVTFFHNVSLLGGPGVFALGRGVTLYEAHEHWLVCPSHVLWRHGRELCTGRQCFRCTLHYGRPPQLWRYTGYLERQLHHIDAFIAKSDFSRRKHAEFGFTRPMSVIPYFLPDRPAQPDHRVSGREVADSETGGGNGPHPRPYVLFVGRLERIKGLDDVLPVMRRHPGVDLLIAGDGDHAAELRRLSEGADNIYFLGRLAPEALRQFYAHAMALVVPSVCYETFGIILIEAFRQGTPVIARRLGPLPEIVERAQAGLLFGSADELDVALGTIATDAALRQRLAVAAAQAFDRYWSESAVLPQYYDLIADVAERKGEHRVAAAFRDEVLA